MEIFGISIRGFKGIRRKLGAGPQWEHAFEAISQDRGNGLAVLLALAASPPWRARSAPPLCVGSAADQSGASSIEYAILAAGIAVAIVSAVRTLGTEVNALYVSVLSAFR